MSAPLPEDCDRLFAEGVNAGDADAVVALYEEGACFVQRGNLATGPIAIRPVIVRMLAEKPRLTCNVRTVVRAGDDVALLYNDWTLSSAVTDGQTVERTGKALGAPATRRHLAVRHRRSLRAESRKAAVPSDRLAS